MAVSGAAQEGQAGEDVWSARLDCQLCCTGGRGEQAGGADGRGESLPGQSVSGSAQRRGGVAGWWWRWQR